MHRLLENGTNKIMRASTKESEWETWWAIPQIKASCAIEYVMDEIITELRAEMQSSQVTQPRQSLGERGNSWSQLSRAEACGSMFKRVPSFIQPDRRVDQLKVPKLDQMQSTNSKSFGLGLGS